MKKYLFGSLIGLILLIVGLVVYGSYLNYAGEHNLAERIADQRIPVKGEQVMVRDMKIVHKMPTITLYAEGMTDAKALVKGHIVKIHVKKNDYVREGEPLCTLMDEELPVKLKKAESDIMAAEAQLKIAQNDYERYQRLYEKEGTSQATVDEKLTTYLSYRSKLDELYANRDLLRVQEMRQDVVAPVDGEVLLFYQHEGSYVDAGTPIALIGNFSTLHCASLLDGPAMTSLTSDSSVQIKFQARDLAKVYDTPYNVPVKPELPDYFVDGITVEATMVNSYPELSEPAAIRKVIWRLDNRSGILEPKNYGDTLWISTRTAPHLSIPLYALLTPSQNLDICQNTVFVLREDGVLEERKIFLGVRDDTYVEVLSGLEEGEIVVTSFPDGLEAGTKAVLVDEEGGS